MSDETPGCCDCKLERYAISVGAVANADLTVPPGTDVGFDDTRWIRGVPAGSFNSLRPVKAVVHTDWCKHRPTKALVNVRHDSAAPNGTVRVFVEGARDFSKYVWAEMEYEAGVPFPDLDARYHTADGVETTGGGYGNTQVNEFTFGFNGPLFGISNGTHVASFLSLEDPDDYIKSPWPVFRPTHAPRGVFDAAYPGLQIAWVGTRCRVRWGYRQNDEDTELGSVAFIANHAPGFTAFNTQFNPAGALFDLGNLAIGCNWSDIGAPNADDNVRCGVELLAPEGFFGTHGYFQNIARFGSFTIPFELPRSFFVDAEIDGDPKPALPYQLVGLEATAPRVSVPVEYKPVTEGGASPAAFIYGNSTNLDAESFESVGTCGARRSAVFIAPSLQSESGTLPAGPVGASPPPEDGIIRATAPLFVRRDDLNERSYNHVANADSWHATHLVRAGSPLAGRNVLHNLNIEIDPCEFEAGNFGFAMLGGYISPGPLRAALVAYGVDFLPRQNFGEIYSLPTDGTRFSIQFASDTSGSDFSALPEAYLWDAISGAHTLAPFGPSDEEEQGERLVPNAYHVFYPEPQVTADVEIVTPEGYTGNGQGVGQIDPKGDLQFRGPFTALPNQVEAFADYETYQCPARLEDYRGEWKIETFPQIWATTELNTDFQRVGPRDISLEDSGMTTENHDAYSSVSVDYVPEDAGVTIRFYCRVGLKVSLNKVKGFRRIREFVPASGTLTYKIPLGRCQYVNLNNVPTCGVVDKVQCLGPTLFGTDPAWTKGVDCEGDTLEDEAAYTLVQRQATEAAAIAEFEQQEADREAYDYSWEPGTSGVHRATDQVGVYGDFSPNDVGCHDRTFEWSVSLTGEEVAQVSAGETVTKQLLVATEQVFTGYDEFDFETYEDIPVYRTVRISVTQAE